MTLLKNITIVLSLVLLTGCSSNSAIKFDKEFMANKDKELYVSPKNITKAGFQEETPSGFALNTSFKVLSLAFGQVGPALSNPEGQYLTVLSEEDNALVEPYDPSDHVYKHVTKHSSKTMGFNFVDDKNAEYSARMITLWGLYNPSVQEGQYRPFFKATYSIRHKAIHSDHSINTVNFICHERSVDVYNRKDVYENNASVIKSFIKDAKKECINIIGKQIEAKIKEDSADPTYSYQHKP